MKRLIWDYLMEMTTLGQRDIRKLAFLRAIVCIQGKTEAAAVR